ncbi:hypothetical protein [Ancylobacter mangrovi]|uniref:hypothetical protein n=1 Tax=Ancylobacter mangrovi TaxID=2972472 RepID=UPI00216255D3|nr:hypothetical protein [Ancylobacter mangrovi]MCS0501376.1 hypothetical protein [Ancylobacter mangrovi]
MADPAWPTGLPYECEASAWSSMPFRPPLVTEMEGGNVRLRARPGDAIEQQGWARRFTPAQFEIWTAFLRDDLAKGTRRFSMPVWLGSAYGTRTVQILRGGGGVTSALVARGLYTRVSFSLLISTEGA